jgi:hypothetical protein
MLTNKSDVYAFGIVMMEILTAAQSPFAITQKVSNNDYFPLEKNSFPFAPVKKIKYHLQANNWKCLYFLGIRGLEIQTS